MPTQTESVRAPRRPQRNAHTVRVTQSLNQLLEPARLSGITGFVKLTQFARNFRHRNFGVASRRRRRRRSCDYCCCCYYYYYYHIHTSLFERASKKSITRATPVLLKMMDEIKSPRSRGIRTATRYARLAQSLIEFVLRVRCSPANESRQ